MMRSIEPHRKGWESRLIHAPITHGASFPEGTPWELGEYSLASIFTIVLNDTKRVIAFEQWTVSVTVRAVKCRQFQVGIDGSCLLRVRGITGIFAVPCA